jgi:hypothetical protein
VRWVPALVAVACALSGCIGDDDGPTTTEAVAAGTAPPAPPPGPGSPFCEGVTAMTARIDGDDPPADVAAFVADSYRELLTVAPPELVPDLEAMITLLGEARPSGTEVVGTEVGGTEVGGTAVASADDVVASVVLVTPGERIADYVAENCGRVGANPGPPATPPAGGYDTVADTAPATSAAAGP